MKYTKLKIIFIFGFPRALRVLCGEIKTFYERINPYREDKIRMAKSLKKHRQLVVAATAVFLFLSSVLPPAVAAQPPRRKPHRAGGIYPHPGFHVRVLPKGHRTVHVGPLEYLFLDGIFYRTGPGGYVVVAAPVGAVIRSLPAAAVMVTIGAITYHIYAGVYYQEVPEGYRVVAPPVKTAKPDEAVAWEGDRIRVTAALLNVRSGPGKDHPVISQVKEGDLLVVQSSSSDWYYVKLPDQSFGWVMVKYTTLVEPKARG